MALPEWISFGKLRGAYSKVGNDIPLFITNSVSHVVAGGGIQANDAAPFEEMRPEMTYSVEVGTEWRFLQSRLGINATYYRTNTRNQSSSCRLFPVIGLHTAMSMPAIYRTKDGS